jgi:predicted NAD/FAD-dependent oxidoreductase
MNALAARVAVIGAGIAGACCAQWLHRAGFAVQVFEKSRGVGGRLTTRRIDWTDAAGATHEASFDHGAPGFQGQSPEFCTFVEQAAHDGLLFQWQFDSINAGPANCLWTPSPDMPALCRALLDGVAVQTLCQIDGLYRDAGGWRLTSQGETVANNIAAVILAIPPAQAAALLEPLRADWAREAKAMLMLPDWTLMGLVSTASDSRPWQLAPPADGILASVHRIHGKPGRKAVPGMAHWVAHATSAWSERHLEAPAAVVQAALQQALERWLGWTPDWRYVAAHRWRYAVSPANASATGDHCWWDALTGLGVCGDAWGGGGVEGAWRSARALAGHLNAICPARE